MPTGPCTVCGATDRCGEDEQGRAWTHQADAGYITAAAVLIFCIAGALLFLAFLGPAQRVVCVINHDEIRYCPGYVEVQR